MTQDAGDNWSLAWSPDGTQIAFATTRDGNFEIYVMDFDGSHQIDLTNDPANDFSPDWSPDGLEILFYTDHDDNYEIYALDVGEALKGGESGGARRLTENDAREFRPAWQPGS